MKLGSSLRRRRGGGRKWGETVEKDPLRLAGLATAIAAVAFCIGYLLATRLLFPAPETPDDLIAVPELRGMERQAALERIREEGLVPGAVDSIRHPTTPAGRVLGQSPLPGQYAVPAGSVRVTVSRGPERRAVPDVYRLRSRHARTVLEATGFEVELDSVDHALPKGSVVTVEPEPGTEVAVPSEVKLTVSLGPPMVEMPLLLGLEETEAEAVLDSLGLVVSQKEERFRFGRDQGIVLEQDPPATTMVERGSAVRLVVGRRGG